MTFHIYLSYFGQSSLSFEVAAKKKKSRLGYISMYFAKLLHFIL